MHTVDNLIPDGQVLYRYAKPAAFPVGQVGIPPGIFNDIEMSCDWQRYRSNPEQSFHIAEGRTVIFAISIHDDIRNPKNPKRDGAIVIEWHQEIIHSPVTAEQDEVHGANIAHSLIKGKKKQPVIVALQANTVLHAQVT